MNALKWIMIVVLAPIWIPVTLAAGAAVYLLIRILWICFMLGILYGALWLCGIPA